MKLFHALPVKLGLALMLLTLHVSRLSAAEIMDQTWKSVKNGVWSTGLKGDIASKKDNVITVNAPGEANTMNVASAEIILNQTTPEKINFSGWLMRHPGGKATKALVAYDLLLLYTDGTHQWLVLESIPLEKAGEWHHTTYVLTPAKPLRALRVLGINNNSDTPASFKEMSVTPAADSTELASKVAFLLENKHVSYQFSQQKENLFLTSICDKSTGTEFINVAAAKGNLWRISLNNAKEKTPLVISGGKSPELTMQGTTLSMKWRNIPLPDGGTLDIHATADLPTESTAVEWHIAANIQNSANYTMRDVAFPVINGLAAPGKPENTCFFFPQDTGRLVKNPAERFPGSLSLRYGTNALTMQFLSLYSADAGLYLATKDGEGFFKEMRFVEQFGTRGVFSFEIFTLAFQGEKSFALPFPVETRLFHGDWYTACMIYRDWALKQKWTACGPMETRQNFPEPLKKIGLSLYGIENLHYNAAQREMRKKLGTSGLSVIPDDQLFDTVGGTIVADAFAARVKQLKEYYGFPLEIFNHPYLDYFGRACPRYMLLRGYVKAARLIRELGCYTVPWTTILRMDVDIERYKKEDAGRFATADESGKPVILFADGCMKALMCPATEYWQNALVDSTEKLLSSNISAIYYDEMSSTGAQVCYNPNHGHTVGGGNYGLNGYRKIMQTMHKKFHEKYPDYYSLAEQNSEYLIGVHDVNYMFLLFHADLVPAFQAIYHEYSLSNSRFPGKFQDYAEEYAYADPGGKTNLEEVAMLGFRNFTFGIHPGVVRFNLVEYSPEGAAIARHLGEMWLKNQKFVMFGRMLRAPEILAGNGVITTGLPFRDSTKYDYPAVRVSAWQALDQSVGLVVTNAGKTLLAPEIKFDASSEVGTPFAALRDRDNHQLIWAGKSADIHLRLPIAGRTAKVFDVVPLEKLPEVPALEIPDFIVSGNENLLEMSAGSTGKVSVTVENTADRAVTAEIKLNTESSWQIQPAAAVKAELPAHSVKTVDFAVTLPQDAKRLASFSYTVNVEKFTLTEKFDIGIRPYVAQEAAGKKCIAAKYLEKIPEERLPESCPVLTDLKAKMLPGDHQHSPTQARFAWNAEELVMEFAVKDTLHHSPAVGEMIWQGDCIQIGLGFPRIESDTAEYFNQYEIYLANIDGKPYVSCSEKAYDAYLKLTTMRRDGETYYRLHVPKRLLREMVKGKKFPFSFTVNEHDGKAFVGWQEWTPGICGGKNKGAWGELLLAE